MDIQKEKNELREMFGDHFEKTLYNIPPLAARKIGLLIIDGCKSGLTFEALVETMGASKISVIPVSTKASNVKPDLHPSMISRPIIRAAKGGILYSFSK